MGESTSVDADLTTPIAVAEMVGALLAASATLHAHLGLDLLRENVRGLARSAGGYRQLLAETRGLFVRGWMRRESVPRMDSLVRLSRGLRVSLLHFLTKRINAGTTPPRACPWKAHYRVASSVVEEALRAALQAAIPPPLREIAGQVGYQSVDPLPFRYRVLCSEIVRKRRTAMRTSHVSPNRAPVPRERIEKALVAELSQEGFTNFDAVAAAVGLSSTRRFYKGFHELRMAIVAKNAAIREHRSQALGAALQRAIETAFNEQPVPTVEEVARRLGYATVKPATSRFPELCKQLRACRPQPRQVERGPQVSMRIDRASEPVRLKLTEALREFPAPSCAQVVRSISGHRTQIRETFPELWRAVHDRYVEHTRQARRVKREAFAGEVCRAFRELRRQGIYPTARLVLAAIPQPQYRSREMVAEILRSARRHEPLAELKEARPREK